jgi:hypothetical protein
VDPHQYVVNRVRFHHIQVFPVSSPKFRAPSALGGDCPAVMT